MNTVLSSRTKIGTARLCRSIVLSVLADGKASVWIPPPLAISIGMRRLRPA
ncbi:hypothetical protein FK220_001535 [Flavobacteriaceae bacterium TP-CH-4]|uniref:Uncharacterized protein n=1 Tax=Pelagihabitans pacificus TaxID=2696054 RepID=A0A967AS99_9FLAO|nr:hypothetical protein [Pelagihabitans pacificus]NHF58003.1 hypothetical protein [Pelagihabitans pacificus]